MEKSFLISFTHRTKTPILLLHDKNDSRVVLDHSRLFYQKLKKIGNLVDHQLELIEFEDTGYLGSTLNEQWAKELI